MTWEYDDPLDEYEAYLKRRTERNRIMGQVAGVVVAILVIGGLGFAFFNPWNRTHERYTVEAATKAGLIDVTVTGWRPLDCGRNDWYETGFSATNPNGDLVEGTVCCGLIFKACTVRY